MYYDGGMTMMTMDRQAKLAFFCEEILAGQWRNDERRRASLVEVLADKVDGDADWVGPAIDRSLPALGELLGKVDLHREEIESRNRLFGGSGDADSAANMLDARLRAIGRLHRYDTVEARHLQSWVEVCTWSTLYDRPYRVEGENSVAEKFLLTGALRQYRVPSTRPWRDYEQASMDGISSEEDQRYYSIAVCHFLRERVAMERKKGAEIDDCVLTDLGPKPPRES
jgi:hypothetical protein